MTSSEESNPLLSSSSSAQGQYYFVDRNPSTMNQLYKAGASSGESGEVNFEEAPKGSSQEDFEPRHITGGAIPQGANVNISMNDSSTRRFSWWSWIFGSQYATSNDSPSYPVQGLQPKQQQHSSRIVRMRKAPVKVEPKVFFSNERTFLAWMHVSILLAGASMTILAFGDARNSDDDGDDVIAVGQLYGLILLPVAVSFILYSLYQYNRRATMIRFRYPGPYEDTAGPVVLGTMLVFSIIAQFALKVYDMTY